MKAGDRYVSVVLGNTKRKTPVERGKTSFAYSDVFHFLVRGAKSAVVEVLLKEDERIGHDKVVGMFKVGVAPRRWVRRCPGLTRECRRKHSMGLERLSKAG